jgi:phasin family protein
MATGDPFKYFSEFQKNLAQFQVPGIDPKQWVETYERNLEAINQASQAIATGMQAYAEKQAAMLQASMEQAQAAQKEATEAGEPADKAAEQLERAKAAYEQAIKDMTEISQIMAKTNAEATEAINRRIRDSFDEMQKLLSKSDD